MAKKRRIIEGHTLDEYDKRYGKSGLRKVLKKYVDKDETLLDGSNWWLVEDTYYEIPKNPFGYWWRNLSKAGKIALCVLGVGAVTTGVVTPVVLAINHKLVTVKASKEDSEGLISGDVTFTKNDSGEFIANVKLNDTSKKLTDLDVTIKVNDNVLDKDKYDVKDNNEIVIKADSGVKDGDTITIEVKSATKYTITVTAGDGGTVTGSGEYNKDSQVTLVATPNTGYTFEGWYENDTKIQSAGSSYTFTATKDRVLTAKFELSKTELSKAQFIAKSQELYDKFAASTSVYDVSQLSNLFYNDEECKIEKISYTKTTDRRCIVFGSTTSKNVNCYAAFYFLYGEYIVNQVSDKNNGGHFYSNSDGTLEYYCDSYPEGEKFWIKSIKYNAFGYITSCEQKVDGKIEKYSINYNGNPQEPSVTKYTITVKSGEGGTVSGGGQYDENSSVTVVATPKEGYIFEGWYEDNKKIIDAGASYNFNVSSARTLEARFTEKAIVLDISTVNINVGATIDVTASLNDKSSQTINFNVPSEYKKYISCSRNGNVFTIGGVENGTAKIEFSCNGYKSIELTVTISNANVSIDQESFQESLNSKGVNVSDLVTSIQGSSPYINFKYTTNQDINVTLNVLNGENIIQTESLSFEQTSESKDSYFVFTAWDKVSGGDTLTFEIGLSAKERFIKIANEWVITNDDSYVNSNLEFTSNDISMTVNGEAVETIGIYSNANFSGQGKHTFIVFQKEGDIQSTVLTGVMYAQEVVLQNNLQEESVEGVTYTFTDTEILYEYNDFVVGFNNLGYFTKISVNDIKCEFTYKDAPKNVRNVVFQYYDSSVNRFREGIATGSSLSDAGYTSLPDNTSGFKWAYEKGDSTTEDFTLDIKITSDMIVFEVPTQQSN